MTEYSKINVIYRLQKWLDSVPGQTFLNYAYSWGASIVILGTLFKLTHLPGANVMLYIGMGTEVIVFFISAFDRPFDKTAIGKDLPTHLEDEAAALEVSSDLNDPRDSNDLKAPSVLNALNVATPSQETFTAAEEATTKYVEELNTLTDTLARVSEQSGRLAIGSEEMENLNRTLTGICKVYEMQLKSASAQIGTIDQINEQTRKMAEQIAELNKIYARMIAMHNG